MAFSERALQQQPPEARPSRRDDEHGVIGLRALIGTSALVGVLGFAAQCGTTNAEYEPGETELSKITLKNPKVCFWEYEAVMMGVGIKRSVLKGAVSAESYTNKDEGVTKRFEVCYDDFEVKPTKNDDGSWSLIVAKKTTMSVEANDVYSVGIDDYDTDVSGSLDLLQAGEGIANTLGFDSADSVSEVKIQTQNSASEAADYRGLDCLETAYDYAQEHTEDEITQQWVDTVNNFVSENGFDTEYRMSASDVREVVLPPIPEKDELSTFMKRLKANNGTVEQGEMSECEEGEPLVVDLTQEANVKGDKND